MDKKQSNSVGNLISHERVMGFSDAVFAFAATLLVLKIDLPATSASSLVSVSDFTLIFKDLWPQYLANIISFLVIGYYWLNHHAIFSMIKKLDSTVVWLNLILLIFVSFLPFPVDLYGSYFGVPLVVVFYSASLAAVGFMLFAIWWYASHNHRLIGEVTDKQIKYYDARNLVAPLAFTISIPLVYFHPLISQLCWVFIILGNVTVNKLYKVKEISISDSEAI